VITEFVMISAICCMNAGILLASSVMYVYRTFTLRHMNVSVGVVLIHRPEENS